MNRDQNADSFIDASEDIVLSFKDREGLLALRISQKRLKRVLDLEDLAVTARLALIQEIRAGFKAETGELAIDSEIIKSGAARLRLVRPARARDGKSPRVFVLSSRERRLVQAWIRRENDNSATVFKILKKVRTRAWVMVRRECQAISARRSWATYQEFLRRECDFHWASAKLRFASLLHPFVDTRPVVAAAFSRLLDFRRVR